VKETILVTGVAGFIGSHLVERLLQLGHELVGIDNFDDYYSPVIKRKNILTALGNDNFKLLEGDIRDASFLNKVFSANNIGTVIHLAARAGVRPSMEQPVLYHDVNVAGTVNLLEASRTFPVKRFVFSSSSSVYGCDSAVPFSEDAKIDNPISPYAASKAAAEIFCRTYSQLYRIPMVVLRLFTVYGPRQRPEMAICRFVRMISKHEEITVFDGGMTSRDYTNINDIVAGIEAALTRRIDGFQVCNLGCGRSVQLNQLVALIEEALGEKARVRYLNSPPGEMPITLADISKAGAVLGYEPRISIEEGISRFVQWYLNNGRK
jgi:UDP-glucuronate 4-epimerase